MRLTIEKIVYPGRRLARHEGQVVFTDRGLPGEVVEAEVFRERKNFAEARTVRVVESSADRREPRCGHFQVCSPYQDMDDAAQLRVKKGQVEEILSRELRRPFEAGEVVPSPEIWGYRNRIRLRAMWRGERLDFAYNEPGEEASFVPVDRCFLVPEATNDLLNEIRERADSGGWTSIAGVEVRRSRSSGGSLVVLDLDSEKDLAAMTSGLEGLRLKHELVGAVGSVFDGKRTVKKRLFGRDFVDERVRGLTYRIGARSFFQINVGILDRVIEDMAAAVARIEAEPVVADLYCGLGTFGMALAGGAREVFGVESDEENIAYLKKNLQLNGIGNFAVCEGTSEEWLPEILERRPDVVILDPPRRGVDPRMTEALAQAAVPLVLYLSCNPATLARDLKPLLETYELAGLQVYDFFPHTPHIECLAILMGDMIPVSHLSERRSP